MSAFIGKTISLISNSDIRYLGILHEINSEESTVSLMKVRTFGTEGRAGGANEIPASDAVYDYVVFRGSDVKDLKIADESELEPQGQVPQSQPQQAQQTQQQQQQQHSPAQSHQPVSQSQPQPQETQKSASPETAQVAPAQTQVPRKTRPEPKQDREPREARQPRENRQPREAREPREPRESREPRETQQRDGDFEFSSNRIEDFKKEMTEDENEQFYNKKSSFFDNISHSTRDQRDPDQNRANRELNMETFGQTDSGFRSSFRGGRGGAGGRGGRGGRGGSRGGNNNTGNRRGGGDGMSNRDRETFGSFNVQGGQQWNSDRPEHNRPRW